jgi:D-glycero-alpha-D-manno-heptose-7-phosphate kinase
MIVARAPLRVPLGGGGTDLPSYYSRFGGFFVSAAIDKYVYVAVNRPAADDLIRVKYSRSEAVTRPEEIAHDLVREALCKLALTANLEVASMADVPAGTGMGSSGSYLVALLLSLHALKRDHLPKWAVAEEACEIEIERAGHPVGKQDQYAAAWGGLNCYEVEPHGEVRVSPLRTPPYVQEDLGRSVLLYGLDQARESASILGLQKEATDRGDRTVVDSLHRSKELGHEIRAALECGDLVRFGCLLDVHWQNKKARCGGVSNGRVDAVYRLARESGALGGKVMGAGGGGFLMVMAPGDSSRRVREALAAEGLRQLPFAFDLEGAKVLLDL